MASMWLCLFIFSLLCTDLSADSGNVVENAVHNLLNTFPAMSKHFYTLEPEATMTLREMVNYLGYPLETHEVTTEDGYILTNHRIPHGKHGPRINSKKFPVVLIHGSYVNSEIWVVNTAQNSPGILLADAGFDVWMMNYRGNSYSKKHVTLNANRAPFWEFSVDEVGYYDVAAVIDYVLNITGKQQVYLVGHSMGGGLPFILLADRPEYNAKVREIYALSPLGNAAGIRGILPLLAKTVPTILKFLKRMGVHELVVPPWIPKKITGLYIKNVEFAFKAQMFFMMGPTPDSWNSSRSPIFATHGQGGIAINHLLHFTQLANNPGLRHYDWGTRKNLAKYNQSTPPDYNLKKVTARTHLFYAPHDTVICKPNMEFLQRNLANCVSLDFAGHDWNHISYFWAKDAGEFFNSMIASMVNDSAKP